MVWRGDDGQRIRVGEIFIRRGFEMMGELGVIKMC